MCTGFAVFRFAGDPVILSNLEHLVNNRKSMSSVSSRFTNHKQLLGSRWGTNFHNFTRILITELENDGCPEAVTADIVSHNKRTYL